MTFKSEKVSDGKSTVLWLSGHLQSEYLEELSAQIESNGDKIVLDLDQVTMVDVGVIRFLGSCEHEGIELRHCPLFVREWMAREQERTE
jgi:anti-anti-sigma regulatory factor